MNRKEYRKAFDAIKLSPGFKKRTIELLRQHLHAQGQKKAQHK